MVFWVGGRILFVRLSQLCVCVYVCVFKEGKEEREQSEKTQPLILEVTQNPIDLFKNI